jgi:hypothetical protein
MAALFKSAQTQKSRRSPKASGGVKSQEGTMWKVRLCDGRMLTADSVHCEGGALLLEQDRHDGNFDIFMIVPLRRVIEATAEPEATAVA